MEFSDGDELADKYQSLYDIIFLDVEMQRMNGIETARNIRKIDRQVMIVFLTNMSGYAINGYEVKAADYLLKPITYELFELKLREYIHQIEYYQAKNVVLSYSDKMYKLSSDQILYVEVGDHKLIYHTDQGNIEMWGSMKAAEEQLNGMGFAKCNSCYLVNMKHVKRIVKNEVVIGEETLQISRPRKKQFMQDIANFLGGM